MDGWGRRNGEEGWGNMGQVVGQIEGGRENRKKEKD
jgi:hypothetical protein